MSEEHWESAQARVEKAIERIERIERGARVDWNKLPAGGKGRWDIVLLLTRALEGLADIACSKCAEGGCEHVAAQEALSFIRMVTHDPECQDCEKLHEARASKEGLK